MENKSKGIIVICVLLMLPAVGMAQLNMPPNVPNKRYTIDYFVSKRPAPYVASL
ncbi:MAG TPA: hypothetical protein VKA08_11560 [Balneolales bacterium]|nr:hypothetical protein [Balneolales bacterium]